MAGGFASHVNRGGAFHCIGNGAGPIAEQVGHRAPGEHIEGTLSDHHVEGLNVVVANRLVFRDIERRGWQYRCGDRDSGTGTCRSAVEYKIRPYEVGGFVVVISEQISAAEVATVR